MMYRNNVDSTKMGLIFNGRNNYRYTTMVTGILNTC